MMMAGRMGRTRPRSSLQRPGSSAGRPESRAATRAESRAGRPQSRMGPRPLSSIGDRPPSRAVRPESRMTRQDSSLHNERPYTAKDRMQERIDRRNEERAQEQMEKENEPDIDCSTKLKALWMLFSSSLLTKAFIVVGGVVFVFGITMLIIGFATDKFNDGQTVGPVLACVGIIIFIIGLLGFRAAKMDQRKVAHQQDPETGQNEGDKEKNGVLPNEKTNQTKDDKIQSVVFADDSDRGSDSDVDVASKPIVHSKLEKKNSFSSRSNQDIPLVGVARPRTLPPLQMPSKPPPGTKKKKKTKTPRKESLVLGNNSDELPTISSGLSHGISGFKSSYGSSQKYYNDGDDDWTNYRSKTFNYE